jgi:hypothetical protein
MQRRAWKSLFVVLLAMLVGVGAGPQTVMAVTSTLAPASAPTASIDADAYVKQNKPTRNYGLVDTVNVSGTDDPRKGYLRFTISGVSGSITNAVLRLFVDDNGTKNGPQLYATNNSWSETAINWNNAPLAGALIDDKGVLAKNTWIEYNITTLVAGGNGTYSVLLLGQGGDSVDFSSRQSSRPPQVVLTVSTPSFQCPPADVAGFSLDIFFINGDNQLHCSYPVFAGEDPFDFYCLYSPTTGALLQDHDAGLCPGSAVPISASSAALQGESESRPRPDPSEKHK